MPNLNAANVQQQLNRSSPAAADAKMGDVLAEAIAEINRLSAQVASLTTQHNGAMTKLDSDAGVTDTNYNATRAVAAFTATTLKDLENRF